MYCASNPKGLRVIPGGVDPHILHFISERIDPPGSVAAQGLHFLPDIIDTQKLRFWSIPDQRLDPFSVLIFFSIKGRSVPCFGTIPSQWIDPFAVSDSYWIEGWIRTPSCRHCSQDQNSRQDLPL